MPHAPALASQADDHANAVAALTDVKAAIAELVGADASFSTNRTTYRQASQRAINALAGTHGEGYVAAAGTPVDATGAIGHVDALLDRKEAPVWVVPLRGAEANMRAAVVHLQDALKARELMDYEIAASRALTYLEVARGHASETGVFGGLEGALGTTVLGVPEGGREVDACAAPSAAPAYGTHGGYLAWASVPGGDGPHQLAEVLGGTEVYVRGGAIVIRTAAAPLVAAACATHASAVPVPAAEPVNQGGMAKPLNPSPAPATPASAAPAKVEKAAMVSMPALYTKEQAEAGARIFAGKCVSCHGSNLMGTAAPAVAGSDFRNTALRNGWTLAVIRYLVFQMMPLNAPKSLTPTQSASVMAFLLASNCYPAGDTPFPTADKSDFADIKLGPASGDHPAPNSQGVCKVE